MLLACFGLGMIGLVILWFACDLLCVNLFVGVILHCVCGSVVLVFCYVFGLLIVLHIFVVVCFGGLFNLVTCVCLYSYD